MVLAGIFGDDTWISDELYKNVNLSSKKYHFKYEDEGVVIIAERFMECDDNVVAISGTLLTDFQMPITDSRGFFNFCIMDKRNKRLSLGTDHITSEPLYYTKVDSTFVFSSDLQLLVNSLGS